MLSGAQRVSRSTYKEIVSLIHNPDNYSLEALNFCFRDPAVCQTLSVLMSSGSYQFEASTEGIRTADAEPRVVQRQGEMADIKQIPSLDNAISDML